MRAQVQRGFGGDDVVAVEDLAEPVPADGEVLVAVRACGLNRLDLLQREAPLVRGFSLPHVAGMDVAGVVVAHGAGLDAAAPRIGQRVLVDPVSTCGACDRCTAGLEPYCEHLRTIGSTRQGGFAELVATPAGKCFPIPAGMSFVEAACIPVAYMTAWHALVTAGRVQPGETVLVNAAGSGVSTAIVQFAVAAGATVIGTAGGPAKVARALELGCSAAIDHYGEADVAESVLAITGGRGVDLVVDHVGPALFDASIRSLSIDGRMVFCGTTTGTRVEIDLPSLYHWGRTLIGAGGYRPAEFEAMLGAVEASGLRPIVDSVWTFEELTVAQERMATGSFFGKLVVTFDEARQDDARMEHGMSNVAGFRLRLADRSPIVGMVVRTPSHHVIEVLATVEPERRIDVVMLDTEHAPFDLSVIDSTLALALALDLPTLVRVPALERHPIQQALDLGATGIIVPHVDSVESARTAVRLAQYGDGGRGFSPSTRSAGWGSRTMSDILDAAAAQTTVVIQIEEPAALEVLDDIVAVEGVDGLLVGRADLAVALGARRADDERVLAAVERIAASCRAAAMAFGVVVTSTTSDDATACRALGATLILEGTDQTRLRSA